MFKLFDVIKLYSLCRLQWSSLVRLKDYIVFVCSNVQVFLDS